MKILKILKFNTFGGETIKVGDK